jgi:probable phosphoglycerate mutase
VTALILCRHGRTDWNEQGRYQGQTDVLLNEVGRRQAKFLAETLRSEPIAAVFASDLARAVETARDIATVHGLRVSRDRRLREIDQGRWEGLTVPEIRERDASLHTRWEAEPLSVRLPDGESVDDVRKRSLAALYDIVRTFPDQLVCLVSHKVVMTILRCELTGESLEPALRRFPGNASFERVEVPDDLVRDLAPPGLSPAKRLDQELAG